ncbi:transcriptional regulator [Streptomyces chrestomyceticus]|uniref:transcriptional regulator n=1 Tax=Streptomyces chrestomyceticus TaxID=68185 RepID=UPI0033C088C9
MTTIESAAAAATFAACFIALYIGHLLGDHIIQTSAQAEAKGAQGWPGRLACAGHVATLTLAKAGALGAVVLTLHLPVTLPGLVLGGAVDAASHYWADRRFTLLGLVRAIRRGGYLDYGTVVRKPDKDADGTGPGTAAYEIDQTWHTLWLGVAALLIAAI